MIVSRLLVASWLLARLDNSVGRAGIFFARREFPALSLFTLNKRFGTGTDFRDGP